MYAAPSRKRKFSEQVVPGIPVPRDQARPARRKSTDSALANHTSNPFDDADYPIRDFQRVYNLMRDTENGLQVADRRWHLRLYSKCFIGSNAVQWMVDNLSLSREQAVSTGQRLMDAGILHHVTHSEPFCDAYYFYGFQEDDKSNILNMKRIWDSSMPARHAVDVSKDLLTRLALLCEEHRKRILQSKTTSKSPQAKPSSSSISLPNLMPSTPSLPVTPSLADPRHADVLSPVLGRCFPSPGIGNITPVLMSTPHHGRMNSSPILTTTPKHTVGDDVDYSTLAKSEDFRQYTLAAAELQRVQLVALNHDERIAFFVNCYNALCLHEYVTHGSPSSFFRRWIFFRALSYRIAGLDMTLDDIEHGILRSNKRPPMFRIMQQFGPSDPKCQHVLTKRDGRIHFIISAGTRSDPPIRILDGENVQEELHEATVEFLSYSIKLDFERRVVTLPRIFLWYAEDFPAPERSLLMWVAKYIPAEVSQQLVSMLNDSAPDPVVSYENFDWATAEARFNDPFIRRTRRRLERESSGTSALLEQDAFDLSRNGPIDGLSPFDVTNPFASPDDPNSGRLSVGNQRANLEALFPGQPEEYHPRLQNMPQGFDSESGGRSVASKTNGSTRMELGKSNDVQNGESTSKSNKA